MSWFDWPALFVTRVLSLGVFGFIGLLLGMIAILTFASIVFDGIHFVMHKFMNSRFALLRALGGLHGVHHLFYDRKLVIHRELTLKNLLMHHVPEMAVQVTVVLFFFYLVDWIYVVAAEIFWVVTLIIEFVQGGQDFNHRPKPFMPSTRRSLHVCPTYHSLHHVHPDHYFSSIVTVFDRLFGTAMPIAGRTFLVTGSSGAFGAPLCAHLERHGGKVIRARFGVDWKYDDVSGLREAMAGADVLILAHGSKRDHAQEANCDSFVALIEQFLAAHKGRQMAPEVWAVGSEIEAHPHFGNEELKIYSASKRNFAQHAHAYYVDERVHYRHIVPSSFTSRMGKGLISGSAAVAIAMFFIDRGFRYIPVTYTGVAFINYFKFIFSGAMFGRPVPHMVGAGQQPQGIR